jgi:hypothetical protein
MSSLRKDLRNELERTVVKARDIAEAAAKAALQALAVDQPKPFPHMDADARALRNRLRERGRAAGDVRDTFSNSQTLGHLSQLVGYEHWHRMLFARFLAENGLLLEPEYNTPIPLFGRDSVQEIAQLDGVDLWQLAGSYAQRMLPEVFRNDDPALEVTLAREDRVKLEKLLADLDPATFTATDSLGWTYQFWQTKRKKEVNDSGVKIGADEISPVTQLFTEDYMVDFLLDNTLGAWWAGKILGRDGFPQPSVFASEEDARSAVALPGCPWKYLRFIEKDGKWTPASGTFDGWPKSANELKCLDPCMGSGHFVVAMFERLVALRLAEEKLDEAAAVAAVIRDNLFGLEIDPRCTQIGAFNLALAAWRRVGHCKLPAMNLACSGLAPNTRVADWLEMAGDNPRLKFGMQTLYRLFEKAPVLGSLINPNTAAGAGFSFEFHELQPLLEKALAQETKDDTAHEMAVTARGLAKAAEILAGQFTLVATNVPYLGMPKQHEELREFCQTYHPEAKGDLASCFQERSLALCDNGGTTALVSLQNWLYLVTYKKLRSSILNDFTLNFIAGLGPRGFQTPMYDFNVMLGIVTRQQPHKSSVFGGADLSGMGSPEEKAEGLATVTPRFPKQSDQFANPDNRVSLESATGSVLLSSLASSHLGICTGDYPRFGRGFWELASLLKDWSPEHSSVSSTCYVGGMSDVLYWQDGQGDFYDFLCERLGETGISSWLRGGEAWGKKGIIVTAMGDLPVSLYYGNLFDNNVTVIIPDKPEHVAAVWSFCEAPEFRSSVRRINQSLKITDQSMVEIPFDLAHWQKVAAEKYPHGLPKPFSSDPTQWLFNGHPAGADQPLHVAVARLLGYQWPRQTGSSFPDCPALGPDGLEPFCDQDGIVCLTPLRGEAKAADRLRKLLDAAYGDAGWSERQFLATAGKKGSKSTNLEDWLRDEFFQQHCETFHHRPFLWHLWDGRPDGFHALVNYHHLAAPDGAGHKLLETLTFAYLGDWIRRQKDDAANGVPGAESRHIAAESLQQELKNILQGEPPYDLFVRWKPLHQQAIGWHPDLNDGVRLNIRPFLYAKDVKKKAAGILRWQPNVKWTKDRGTEPQRPKTDFPWFWIWDEKTPDFQGSAKFDGNRWNDLHYSNETKQAARAREGAGS